MNFLQSWMPRLAFAPQNQAPRGDVLVCVFQRGAMDGLNALVPMGDSEYYRLRPTLSIAESKVGDAKSVVNLDGFFGLHPALAPLKPIYDEGMLAPIHACGSPDPTHYILMRWMRWSVGHRAHMLWVAAGWGGIWRP